MRDREISIHALLAESDEATFLKTSQYSIYFYPRSPCGERPQDPQTYHQCQIFLSTLSLRRATNTQKRHLAKHPYFYPRSPCGERQKISENQYTQTSYFYPRSPCGERQEDMMFEEQTEQISIHALLAESDPRGGGYFHFIPNISIHALLAESDHGGPIMQFNICTFLSTLSLRRATF